MISDDAWKHAETVAQIASAAGTLAAVIVSLYLARHQNAPKLRASASLGHLVAQGLPEATQQVMRVSITNAGFRDVTIESFSWRIGIVRRAYFFQTLVAHPLNGNLPRKLPPSERVTFVFPWEQYLTNSVELRQIFGRRRLARRLRGRSTRLIISLSTGENLTFPIAKELRRALVSASVSAGAS